MGQSTLAKCPPRTFRESHDLSRGTNLEDVSRGLQLGLFLILVYGGSGDGVVHAHLSSGLGKVLVQLDLELAE